MAGYADGAAEEPLSNNHTERNQTTEQPTVHPTLSISAAISAANGVRV